MWRYQHSSDAESPITAFKYVFALDEIPPPYRVGPLNMLSSLLSLSDALGALGSERDEGGRDFHGSPESAILKIQ